MNQIAVCVAIVYTNSTQVCLLSSQRFDKTTTVSTSPSGAQQWFDALHRTREFNSIVYSILCISE